MCNSLIIWCTVAFAFDSPKYATKNKSIVHKEVLFVDMLLLLLCVKDKARHIKQSFKLFISLKT
jgi:hypothetical protein